MGGVDDTDTAAEELAWVRWRLDKIVSGRLMSPLSDGELEQFNMLSLRELDLLQRNELSVKPSSARPDVSLAQALALVACV